MKTKETKAYLLKNYNIDIATLDTFFVFLGKSIQDKYKLYKKNKYSLKKNEITIEEDCDYSEEESPEIFEKNEFSIFSNKTENMINYEFPDIEFENQMNDEFEVFKDILEQDNQYYLRNNIKIDDFYRLFAPYYNPVF